MFAIVSIKPASLKKTFIVSFLIHIIAILFLSLTIKNIQLNKVEEPLIVTVDAGEFQTAYGTEDTQAETTTESSRAPTLRERIAQADARQSSQQENPIRQALREIADYVPTRTPRSARSPRPIRPIP